jgi:hypothetical protein
VFRNAIHESFVFPRKLFERRSGTGILPVRFNQADLFGNSRAGRPCHYFGRGYGRAKSLAVPAETTGAWNGQHCRLGMVDDGFC